MHYRTVSSGYYIGYGEVGALLDAQGRYEEAEGMEFEVLELRQGILGDKHPEVSWLYIIWRLRSMRLRNMMKLRS